jgi:hypothetical protein
MVDRYENIVNKDTSYKTAVKADDNDRVFENIQNMSVLDVLFDLYPHF